MIFKKNGCDLSGFDMLIPFWTTSSEIFIFGGDGTFLQALSLFPLGSIKSTVFPYNLGRFGALLPLNTEALSKKLASHVNLQKRSTSNPYSNTKEEYSSLFNDLYRTVVVDRLHIKSHGVCFVNELVIRSSSFKLNTFTIYLSNDTATDKFENSIDIRGDALVISTPSGSTGYSYSGNGPVILSHSVVINCIAPNNCNFRPIVVDYSTKIKVEAKGCCAYADRIEIDAQDEYLVEYGDNFKMAVEEDYNILDRVEKML